MSFRSASFLLFLAAASAVALPACSTETRGPRYASEFTLVELDPAAPAPLQLAVQACAGLNNRELGGSVYVQVDAHDEQWLTDLDLTPSTTLTAQEFLDECVSQFPTCVRYDYTDQQKLLPNILTVAAALGAVPLDEGLDAACGDVAFDATVELADKDTPYLATQYVFQNYIDRTTGLAMLDPGYKQDPVDFSNPPIDRDMSASLVDYVFSRKLFVVFLINGCIDSNPEKALLSEIVNSGQWETPLGVYGYNDSWLQGGYLYEAQTRCLDSRNMGAIASGVRNLAFFSTRRAPITATTELEHNAPEDVQYDPTKTYVAFVVGDGDNIHFIMTSRHDWIQSRLADCAQPGSSCPPLTWTISPHLPDVAPDVLAWYYASAHQTGSDYFMLPPSGHLYAYPASMNPEDQDRFVAETERDAKILGTHSTIDWEFNSTWYDAETEFLPKYATVDGAIRGVFTTNVPYLIDAFTWWPLGQQYEILTGGDGGKVAVFRQHEWRGVDGSDTQFFPTPQTMADTLEALPPGTVTWVYMTSDGGLTLDNSFMALVDLLPSRVQLVSADTAARLALDANGG